MAATPHSSTPRPIPDPDAPDFVARLLRESPPRDRRALEQIQAQLGLPSLEGTVVRLRRLHALLEAQARAGNPRALRVLREATPAWTAVSRWISTADRRWARRVVARETARTARQRRTPGP